MGKIEAINLSDAGSERLTVLGDRRLASGKRRRGRRPLVVGEVEGGEGVDGLRELGGKAGAVLRESGGESGGGSG